MDDLPLTKRHRTTDEIARDYFEHGSKRDDLKGKIDALRKSYRERIKDEEKAMERLQEERRESEAAAVGKASLGL